MGADKKFGLLVEMKSDVKQFQQGMDKSKASTKKLGGAFKGMTSQMTGQFNRMTGGLGSGLGVIKSMVPAIKTVRMALITSGIGAIVVAIGIAFAAASASINRTAEGSDKFKQKLGLLKGAVNVLLDRLVDLWGALIKFAAGDFKGAWQDAKKAVTGVKDEIIAEAEATMNLVKAEQQLRDVRRSWMVEEAKLRDKIAVLILQSRDITKSTTERQEILNKALELQKQKGQQNIDNAKEELRIQEARMKLGHDSNEDLDKQAELTRVVYELGKKNLDQQREIVNRIREAGNSLSVNEKLTKKINENIFKTVESAGMLTAEIITMKSIKLDTKQLGIDDLTTDLELGTYMMAKMQEQMKALAEEGNVVGKVLYGSLIQNLGMLEGQLVEGANSFAEYGESVKQAVKGIIGAMLAEGIAAMVTGALRDTALFSGPFGFLLAPVVGALAGGLAKTAFNSMIPDFAAGAIVSGETIARVGEYPGARSNPEIISPLSDLKGMLGMGGGVVEFEIRGDKLVGVLQNYSQRNKLMA